ncbi:CvfB family protein [Helicovermis profundi]|uniref:S1-like domain-containing RNA-binding protein n=1 Tax=Helicovermis profundi TaxID=3065157 RepID=A0AAU9E5N8_9FIRM|nr:S1-like domain-containing RNA-binding protein [Clostridia bacterium S502]
MIEVGKFYNLEVVNIKDIGVYLNEKGEGGLDSVFLPKSEVPKDVELGYLLDVFIYRDSKDRLIATRKKPLIKLGEIEVLEVVDINKVGAFLDWGLGKNLLLPFKEQIIEVKKDDKCVVKMYVDKSGRLCATAKLYNILEMNAPYKTGDLVKGVAYQIKDDMGIFVAIDNKYHGMIPKREIYGDVKVGDLLEARVTNVRNDGKLDISVREKSHLQIENDYKIVVEKLVENNGFLPYNDKTDKEIINKEFKMSKRAFKKVVGRLLKENKIEFKDNGIQSL